MRQVSKRFKKKNLGRKNLALELTEEFNHLLRFLRPRKCINITLGDLCRQIFVSHKKGGCKNCNISSKRNTHKTWEDQTYKVILLNSRFLTIKTFLLSILRREKARVRVMIVNNINARQVTRGQL